MKPGHGEVLLAEGDPQCARRRSGWSRSSARQLDEGMWAAVPTTNPAAAGARRSMVQDYAEVPREAERVIFFPRAAGG